MRDADLNEAKTRKLFIDKALTRAGWGPILPHEENVQYTHASVEEYPTAKGPADYILFHEGKAVACVEGKRVRVGPQNVLQQAKRYARGFPPGPQITVHQMASGPFSPVLTRMTSSTGRTNYTQSKKAK